MIRILWIFLALTGATLLSSALRADIDVYSFTNEDNRLQYLELTKQLRCPKCQNQDIADSNAPIASDMRREVHRLIEEGQSKDDIVAFMVDRFGEFVTYKPKLIPATYLLWFGPWILVIFGVILIVVMARGRRTRQAGSESSGEGIDTELDTRQRQQLEELITRYSDDATADKDSSNGNQ